MERHPPRNASQRRSPSRPSFQAPTKASLARSHPEVLERALSRSPTRNARRGSQDDKQKDAEARAFGLRDRKALRPSITLTASPSNSLNQGSQSPFASRRSSGLGAFAAPPRRVSKRISASDFFFQSPIVSQETRMEASLENTPEGQLASELGSATGADMSGDMDGPSLHDGDAFEEPDLPPTPTQLGLEPPPGRPKGLLSSSPSKQPARRGKRRATGVLESSPSKLRTVDYGTGPEDLTEYVATMNDPLCTGSVIKKRRVRRELAADLESLKRDIAKLEGFCEKIEQESEDIEPHLNDLSSLLISTDSSHTNSNKPHANDLTVSALISTLLPFSTKRPPKPRRPEPELNPFALDQNAQTDSYLSALAPLTITASSNTVSTSKSGRFVARHQIELSAPRPFPPNLYRSSVFYESNPETQSLVSLTANVDQKAPFCLRQWLNKRLENPLLKLDVCGLCWGINRYWEALVSRAQIWVQIEEQTSHLLPGRNNRIDTTKSNLNRTDSLINDVRRLLPHLERSSMLFTSTQRPLEVLLSCEITIDEWSGEPELTPTICVSPSGFVSGSNERLEQDSKKLFQAILAEKTTDQAGAAGGSDAQATVKATTCVLDTLFGVNGGKKS
ncbi:uncharacterized protein BDV17DRAFT_191891 [Aspergillus undulatus]|uniref:uncharacterized protein n=1 Tax=Aspergillus undulatus TaxID=1810928 RepID=UPI003CCDDE89